MILPLSYWSAPGGESPGGQFCGSAQLGDGLAGFDDDPARCGEKILEAIQGAWIEELDVYLFFGAAHLRNRAIARTSTMSPAELCATVLRLQRLRIRENSVIYDFGPVWTQSNCRFDVLAAQQSFQRACALSSWHR